MPDCSARHKQGSLVELALEYMTFRNTRDLERLGENQNSPDWKRLCTFFKGLRFESNMNPRARHKDNKIHGLVPAAGMFRCTSVELVMLRTRIGEIVFAKRNEDSITVQVQYRC
jgi:hypothetical protein